ncbi:MAG: hypothetical protein IJY39_14340 [Clostridia bacterium]|nr:hypothetical protein [Clostridia bacterium]
MTLDKKAIDMLLSLDDKKLAMVIARLAKDAGIDPSTLNVGPSELAGIRAALSVATDSDIARAGELLQNYKNGKKG